MKKIFGKLSWIETMHIEEINFEDVFDVQAMRGEFSFSTQGRSCYGVNLGNKVVPRPGERFAIAFVRPGDWSTVLAWRDLASGEVRFKQPSWAAVLILASDLVWFGPLVMAGGFALAGEWIVACVVAALFVAGMLTVCIREAMRHRLAERALLCVAP